MKILVPVDLIHPIVPTLDLLKNLMDLSQAEVKLLYVREMLPAYENLSQTMGSFAQDWDRQLDARAHQIFNEASEHAQASCQSLKNEVTSGPTAMMIEAVAKDEAYDVTVVTPGEHNPAERVLLGTVTPQVVAHVPGTVVVARPHKDRPTGAVANVLIGFDGSPHSVNALNKAVQIFRLKDTGVKVTVVHSVDIAEPLKVLTPIAFVSSLEQNLLMQGEALLAQADKMLKDSGVKNVDLKLVETNPAQELIKIAREIAADLIVVGAQGRSAVERFWVGSVSQKVAVGAPCSVAVVKMTTKQRQK